ncbi:MAG: DUF2142 domain-containing protein [Methanobrevibacter sp.]|uniref:DUF2142 domain-containing protein n=1 Tax=Methanobrevibacter sp. TaxID=66852 RepID=UPI0026E04801|nr:DUF2142 domain-containing protein [Methanobrevibacter sp.]MDO5849516.1 DUF2142 domain-containing protein [Methanobrevibacter sp.]
MNNVLNEYYGLLIDKKHLIVIYVVAILLLTIGMFSPKNFQYPTTEILFFIFTVFLGIFLILYSLKHQNEIHKIAFLVIIIVGGLSVFFAPPFIIPDEYFHINHVLDILNGNLFSNSYRVPVNKFYEPLYANLYHSLKIDPGIRTLLLNNEVAFKPISNYGEIYLLDRTTESPFYAYIFSALGLYIAKALNVGIVCAIWLSRIPNLLVYAFVTYFVIKKAPLYKMALLVITCNPLILSLVASSNYDSFNFMCLIVAIGFFLLMYENQVKLKYLLGFVVCCILMGLVKPQFLFTAVLLFIIPFKNFNFKRINHKQYRIIISAIVALIIVIMVVGMFLILKGNISPGVNGHRQLIYLASHPNHVFSVFGDGLNFLQNLTVSTPGYRKYFVDSFKGAELYNILYSAFFIGFSIFYPLKIKLSKNKRIFLGIAILIFYFGTFFLIYLMWHAVGGAHVTGAQARYFIPALPLIPLILNYPFRKIENIKDYTFLGVIIFSVSLLMFLVTHFY